MTPTIKYLLCVLSFMFLLTLNVFGQRTEKEKFEFVENKGQWEDQINFLLKGSPGDIYFEDQAVTFNLYDKRKVYDLKHGKTTPGDTIIDGHAYRVSFVNAQTPTFRTKYTTTHYSNFFLGNNPNKWTKNVHSYGQISYNDLYANIDLNYYGSYGQLKYDFIVHPHGNPNDILLHYDGIDELFLKNGHVFLSTSLGKVIEQSPYAYQVIDGQKKEIKCSYHLSGNDLQFNIEEPYDNSSDLIIDPVLTFATYTGSIANNFGCTATFDNDGNTYIGGTVFAAGYPTTTGAFQTTFKGGDTDMGISKINTNGTGAIYSTYIGGTESETPHSLVVNSKNELCILGTTGSSDFPIVNGYDNSFNGGPALDFGQGYGFSYDNGCDIIVIKLAADGQSIVGSTYMGGTNNDGINRGSLLHYNYGDAFRGEIIVDGNDNVLVASTTNSTNFPTKNGFQNSFAGGELDACVFKLLPDLNDLVWSSYFGGSDYDCSYSVQLGNNGDVYITGGTISTDLPVSSNALKSNFSGGSADGFITRINSSGSSIKACTYIGTSGYDQCFFVQTDPDDNVFVVGQTDGTYPIVGNVYSVPNSGQFIHKLDNNLSSTLMSTTFGRGTGKVDISISAFLVSDCGPIYISGWGGPLNGVAFYGAHAENSSTSGLPVAGGPYQSTTDGEDFYLIVLGEDASSLNYASYLGGSSSAEHVDGGTSRFDKHGKVYQAVCAGCGGNSDFPTTPGAWSNTNDAAVPTPTGCNLAVFKFDLAFVTPVITATDPYACAPGSYTFGNSSQGANSFFWDFGDGNSSTEFSPTHTYQSPGTYTVMLVGEDTSSCLAPDTTFMSLDVFESGVATAGSLADTICPNDTVAIFATGGGTYIWTPGEYIGNKNGANTIAFPPVTTTYQVVVNNICLNDTLEVTVHVYDENVGVMGDTNICVGESVTLNAFGATSYFWYPDVNLSNQNISSPTASPTAHQLYYVDLTTPAGCVVTDSVNVTVAPGPPIPILSNDTTICYGDSVLIFAYGAPIVQWEPVDIISGPTDSVTYATPDTTTNFQVALTNGCGTTNGNIRVIVRRIKLLDINDTVICHGDSIQLFTHGGGSQFFWTPGNSLSDSTVYNPWAFPSENTTYNVLTKDICGSDTTSVTVNIFENNTSVSGEEAVCLGDQITINAFGGINYNWYPDVGINNPSSNSPTVTPTDTMYYYVDITTSNGCVYTDSVLISVPDDVPTPQVWQDTTICQGDTAILWAGGAPSIVWYVDPFLSEFINDTMQTWPPESVSTTVEFANACGSSFADIQINVKPVQLVTSSDTTICPGDSAFISASGMDYYSWSPSTTLYTPDSSSSIAVPTNSTRYTVIGTDTLGCITSNSVLVDIYPTPIVDAGDDIFSEFGETITLEGDADGNYHWESNDFLSCYECLQPNLTPTISGEHILYTVDEHGCTNSDTVYVQLNGIIYVPNTFSPNADGVNDLFYVKGFDINDFKLYIFNRWGELIFESDSMLYGWDGTYKGIAVQIDTYVWKVVYSNYNNITYELIGHVNVIR